MTEAYRFIAAEKANYPISLMSRMLGVSRQAFYAWERRPPSRRALEDAFLTERIREIHRDNRGVYGTPRIHAELRMAQGIRVSRKRVAADARGWDQRPGAEEAWAHDDPRARGEGCR